MSTYTDLKNRIKDNVTVIRRPGCPEDGMTPQLVKFMNPENEYYGTFKGGIDSNSTTLTNAKIEGSIITDSTLSNVSIDGIDLDNVINELQRIDTSADQAMSVANDVAKDLSDEISARKLCAKKIYDELSCAISSVSNDLLDKISDVVDQLSDVSTDIALSICTLFNNDSTISDEIGKISNDLTSQISNVSSDVLSQMSDISSDQQNQIGNVFSQLQKDQIKHTIDIRNLANKIDNDVLNEANFRVEGDKRVLENAMEYCNLNRLYKFVTTKNNAFCHKLENFAINNINTSIPLAHISFKGKTLGKIVNVELESTKSCCDDCNKKISSITIEFYDNLEQPFSQLTKYGKYKYVLTSTNPAIDVGFGYEIRVDNIDSETNIEKINIVFQTIDNKTTYDISSNATNKIAGVAYDLKTGLNGIESCYIELNDGIKATLSAHETFIDEPSRKIILNGYGLSVLNGYAKRNIQIISSDTPKCPSMGIIYEGGIKTDDENNISLIDIEIDGEKHQISANSKLEIDGKTYDIQDNVLCKYNKQRLFVYEAERIDPKCASYAKLTVGNAENEFNKTIADEFDTASVTIENISELSGTYEIEKQSDGTFTYNDEEREFSITLNGQYLTIRHGGRSLVLPIDTSSYIEQVWDELIERSKPILTEYPSIIDEYKTIDEYTIANSPNMEHVYCELTNKFADDENTCICIEMPEHIPGYSREFITQFNLPHSAISAIKLDLHIQCEIGHNLKLEHLGNEIESIKVKSGKTTSLKFQEIDTNRFVVTDVDDSEIAGMIHAIKHKLHSTNDKICEIIDTINNTTDDISKLSINLSTEISSLSTNLSTEIDNLSTNLSAEISSLSTALSNETKERIFIKNPDSPEFATGKYSKLSVVKIEENEYNQMVLLNQLDHNVLYVVSSDFINAYNQQIKYVAKPSGEYDAVNKQYIDDKLTTLHDKLFNNASMSKILSSLSLSTNSNDLISAIICLRDALSCFANN